MTSLNSRFIRETAMFAILLKYLCCTKKKNDFLIFTHYQNTHQCTLAENYMNKNIKIRYKLNENTNFF